MLDQSINDIAVFPYVYTNAFCTLEGRVLRDMGSNFNFYRYLKILEVAMSRKTPPSKVCIKSNCK